MALVVDSQVLNVRWGHYSQVGEVSLYRLNHLQLFARFPRIYMITYVE